MRRVIELIVSSKIVYMALNNRLSFFLFRSLISFFEIKLLKTVGKDYFDREYYLQKNPDVAQSKIDPLKHYVKWGDRENRKPNPIFDPLYYSLQIGRPKFLCISTLSHFIIYGEKKKISPCYWFDFHFYENNNPDVAIATVRTYGHFLKYGRRESRQTSAHFSPFHYLENNPDVAESGEYAIDHFIEFGADEDRRPVPLTDQVTAHDELMQQPDYTEELLKLPARKTDSSEVDVVIPVYRSYIATIASIYHALVAENKTDYEVVVVNDCSPNPDITDLLRKLHSNKVITLIENESNLGFIGSVNAGMQLHTDRDIILLNSDTEVYHDWVDRLIATAYLEDTISTVTPLTNNGTICSYPRFVSDNTDSLGVDFAKVDLMAKEMFAGKWQEIPTAVGFCMFIKRESLDRLGYFDTAFGRGYGEENDFCLRGQQAGLKDVVAIDVFVRHLGSLSFRGEMPERVAHAMDLITSRYPDYLKNVGRYISEDPLLPVRKRLDQKRLEALKKDKNVLLVTHTRGGGTEQHVQEEISRYTAEGFGVFMMTADQSRATKSFIKIYYEGCDNFINIPSADLQSEYETVREMLDDLDISKVDVHHLADFSKNFPSMLRFLFEDLNIPYSFMVHDYLCICPRINLADKHGFYCGEPESEKCNMCLVMDGNEFSVFDITGWRKRYGAFMEGAEKVFCPNEDVQIRLSRYFPEVDFCVKPHDDITRSVRLNEKSDPSKYRVGVLGGLSYIKGYSVIEGCARAALKNKQDIEYVIVGYTADDENLDKLGVEITGAYLNDRVLDIIEANSLDALIFPATWPETFSYTLSIAFKVGLPIIYSDIGAIANRLADQECSLCLSIDELQNHLGVNSKILQFLNSHYREQ